MLPVPPMLVTLAVYQAPPVTPLEQLALFAALAVAIGAVVRVVHARAARRRGRRHNANAEYRPLDLFRETASSSGRRAGLRLPPTLPYSAPAQRGAGPAAAPGPAGVEPRSAPASAAAAESRFAPPSRPQPQPGGDPRPAETRTAQPRQSARARPKREPSKQRAVPAAAPQERAAGKLEVQPVQPVARADASAAVEVVESGSVRFHRPDGTLQLLPGRLEIVAGSDTHEEIRFVRVSGREANVTFGRSSGEPHAHVQLQSPTVSRMHARMRYADGGWSVTNLSGTNPVIVNGREISENGNEHRLQDGDRLEMGEIVFRFRSR